VAGKKLERRTLKLGFEAKCAPTHYGMEPSTADDGKANFQAGEVAGCPTLYEPAEQPVHYSSGTRTNSQQPRTGTDKDKHSQDESVN
jgi:hypothetical protein